ncbi:hypothetical protein [Andreprevotia chitinilytica]|uniref:hypothetical protein n=1 Tax=Andreprevotia chitinilytica TaxID=396808 RepID=UPI0012ECA202|nr:hypothetical protein [Andreprevotia chitinilytica]
MRHLFGVTGRTYAFIMAQQGRVSRLFLTQRKTPPANGGVLASTYFLLMIG